MTEEESIKADVRLYIAEMFIVNLYAMTFLQIAPSDPLGVFQQVVDQMIQGTRQKTFPQLDPTMSDLISGELEVAANRFASMVTAQIDLVLKARKP
jgi:hypothetical protein